MVTNTGLLLCALPVPSTVRELASISDLVALASTLPLLHLAVRASRRAKADPSPSGWGRTRVPRARPAGQVAGLAATRLAAVAMAVAAGVAVDPATLGATNSVSAAAIVAATGETTTVNVEARDMRFAPAAISVPAGNRLVIVLTNTHDEDVHDLVLDTGAPSGRLAPGETARVDVGVVGRDLEGWYSVIGHKQMGMVLTVDVSGSAPTTPAGSSEGHAAHQHGPGGNDANQSPAETDGAAEGEQTPARDNLDLMAEPSPGRAARDAALPPLPESRLHRRTFVVRDVVREVAPGVTHRLWTYEGTAPGHRDHRRIGHLHDPGAGQHGDGQGAHRDPVRRRQFLGTEFTISRRNDTSSPAAPYRNTPTDQDMIASTASSCRTGSKTGSMVAAATATDWPATTQMNQVLVAVASTGVPADPGLRSTAPRSREPARPLPRPPATPRSPRESL